MVRGNVVAHKKDVKGNAIGRAHANLMADTRLYEVEFPGGAMTELTIDVIAESMYVNMMQRRISTFSNTL